MKKIILLILIILGFIMPTFAEGQTILPSVNGIVEDLQSKTIKAPDSGQDNIKQIAKVKILNGRFKGEEVLLDNMLTGNPEYDIPIKKGSKVVLHVESDSAKSQIVSVDDVNFYIADVQRDNILMIFGGIFALLLLVIGKKKGLYSLVSIIATTSLIFFMLVPMILTGFCPIGSAVLVSVFATFITVYLVGGLNSKSSAASIGICLSLIFAAILSMLVIYLANLTGFAHEETTFLYASRPDLNFKGILTASMILASLGAIMDIGVSIASTVNEVFETNPDLTIKELFTSGMNVGKDIIGTMANTLILVYLGSSLPLILLSSNIDMNKFFNLNQVATEILSAIVGSVALLICVPLTAILAAWLLKRSKSPSVNQENLGN